MAPAGAKIDRNKDLLRIVIDHGTGELKIAAQWIPAGASNRNPQPFAIKIGENEPTIPQKAVLDGTLDKGRLILGEEDVNQWARTHPGQLGNICQLWKLVLSKEYRDTPTGKAVFKAIGAEHGNMETFEEYLTMHFKQVRELIIIYLMADRSNYPNLQQMTEKEAMEYWTDGVQVETLLMVPAKWSQDSQSIMIAAATDAGFKNVGAVYESLVAVASEVYGAEEKNRLRKGDVIAVTDIGRGTVDISSGMVDPETHVLKLAATYSTCGTAGTQRVIDFGRDWTEICPEVLKHGKNINEVCKRMGISVAEFRYQVSNELEEAQKRFPKKFDFTMTIRAPAGWDKIDNGLAKLTIDVPYEKMTEWFDRWFDEIRALLEDHFRQHADGEVHGAIVAGGGARNSYIRKKLDEYFICKIGRPCFDPQDRTPTCFAALKHYPENHAQQLPEGVLYICRGEEWDNELHPDARPGNGLIKRHLVTTEEGMPRTRVQWVEERLTTIMSRKDGQQPVGRRVVMVFNVPTSNPARLKFPLFHSTNPNKEHQAAFDKHRDPQAGLLQWTVRFANMTGEFSNHEFPAKEINGRRHHIVTTIVAVEGDDTHLDLVLQVIKDQDLQYDSQGQARTDVHYEPLIERRMEVWDRFRSYFPIEDEACPPEKIKPAVAADNDRPFRKFGRASTSMPTSKRSQPSQQLVASMAQQTLSDGTSQTSDPQRMDSGISVMSSSRESSLFVGDTPKARGSRGPPSQEHRTKLRHPDKRKRRHLSGATGIQPGNVYDIEGSDDELSRPVKRSMTKAKSRSPTTKAKQSMSKNSKGSKAQEEVQVTALFQRFDSNDVSDKDDNENITVTPRNAFQAPPAPMFSPSTSSPMSTPPRSAPAPSRQGESSPDIKAGLDEASRFLDDTSTWLYNRDRVWKP